MKKVEQKPQEYKAGTILPSRLGGKSVVIGTGPLSCGLAPKNIMSIIKDGDCCDNEVEKAVE